MNWDAIGAAGEILGALAVVVSIGYLSIQIRSNTRATRASAGFDAMHSWADSNLWIAGLERVLALNKYGRRTAVSVRQKHHINHGEAPQLLRRNR
jgi:hypothetical protein